MRSGKTIVQQARSEQLLVETIKDETVVYDLESKEAHCLKPLAAFVFAHADGQTTVGRLAVEAREQLAVPVTDADVLEAVDQLTQSALLDSPPVLVTTAFGTAREGITRRDAVRRGAFAGAVAAVGGTLVTTIAAPAAYAACSGQPAGCSCKPNGGNKQCASGHCCGSGGGAESCNIGCCAADNNGGSCKCVAGICNSIPLPTSGCCAGTCTPSVQGAAC